MLKYRITFFLKITVSASLVGYLFYKIGSQEFFNRLQGLDFSLLALPLALFFATIPMQAFRYYRLLNLHSRIPFPSVLQLTWTGAFFSQTLPSVMAGDVVRVVYLRRYGFHFTESLAVTLADRLQGFLATILTLGAAIPWLLYSIEDRLVSGAVALLFLGGITGWLVAATLDLAAAWLPEVIRRHKLIDNLKTAAGFLRKATFKPANMLPGLALSLLMQTIQALLIWRLAAAFDLPLSYWAVLFIMPVATLAGLLPISIGGWGVREVILVSLFGLIGAPPEAVLPVSILFGVLNTFIALPGLVTWLAMKRKTEAPNP